MQSYSVYACGPNSLALTDSWARRRTTPIPKLVWTKLNSLVMQLVQEKDIYNYKSIPPDAT